MCNDCKGNLKLISYKWNEESLVYKFKCEDCEKELLMLKEYDEDELKEILFDKDFYNDL